MKKINFFFFLAWASLLPLCAAKAHTHSEVHAICAKAVDYSGCVKVFSRKGGTKTSHASAKSIDVEGLLKSVSVDSSARDRAEREKFISTHSKLLHYFWSTGSAERNPLLPEVKLLTRYDSYQGCGGGRAIDHPNTYCHLGTNEMYVDADDLLDKVPQRFSKNLNINALELAILAHEWGHHVNGYSGRGPFPAYEEDAADWRAGKYFGWLLSRQALTIDDFANASNMFFSIGDFYHQTPHNNSKGRLEAFLKGVAEQKGSSGITTRDGWGMDTDSTFSRTIQDKSINNESKAFEVYRFEIERASQVAGNILRAALGVSQCLSNDSESCRRAILSQGKSKADGWFRKRKMSINCVSNTFDIEDDGIARQSITADQKGQAQVLFASYCVE